MEKTAERVRELIFADLKLTEALPNHLNDCKTKELLDVVSQLHRHL